MTSEQVKRIYLLWVRSRFQFSVIFEDVVDNCPPGFRPVILAPTSSRSWDRYYRFQTVAGNACGKRLQLIKLEQCMTPPGTT
jgi:hypothetical protein